MHKRCDSTGSRMMSERGKKEADKGCEFVQSCVEFGRRREGTYGTTRPGTVGPLDSKAVGTSESNTHYLFKCRERTRDFECH